MDGTKISTDCGAVYKMFPLNQKFLFWPVYNPRNLSFYYLMNLLSGDDFQ